MRELLAAMVLLGASAAADRAAAVDYPWCVHYSMDGDASNCGFVSFEQCRMTAIGAAGYCQRNPFYVGSDNALKPAPATKRRHKN